MVRGVDRIRLIDYIPEPNPDWNSNQPDPGTSTAPYRIYNIGNNSPVRLLDFIDTLEAELGRKTERVMRPMQPGDVYQTYADVEDYHKAVGFQPCTPLSEGIAKFVEWYVEYYHIE